jgi:hypothetical protein
LPKNWITQIERPVDSPHDKPYLGFEVSDYTGLENCSMLVLRPTVANSSTLLEGHSQPCALHIEDRFQVSPGRYRLEVIRNHVDIVCED